MQNTIENVKEYGQEGEVSYSLVLAKFFEITTVVNYLEKES